MTAVEVLDLIPILDLAHKISTNNKLLTALNQPTHLTANSLMNLNLFTFGGAIQIHPVNPNSGQIVFRNLN
jgi:hypothetical protein